MSRGPGYFSAGRGLFAVRPLVEDEDEAPGWEAEDELAALPERERRALAEALRGWRRRLREAGDEG